MSLARGGWRGAAFALPLVQQGKRDKHATTYQSHGFDLIPLGFCLRLRRYSRAFLGNTIHMKILKSGRHMLGSSAPLLY